MGLDPNRSEVRDCGQSKELFNFKDSKWIYRRIIEHVGKNDKENI